MYYSSQSEVLGLLGILVNSFFFIIAELFFGFNMFIPHILLTAIEGFTFRDIDRETPILF